MKKAGYTLLEMIVVVMIISVLFLLAIPNVNKVMDTIDNKACDALTKVVDTAIIQFKLDYGVPPNNIQDLVNAGYISDQQKTCSNGKALRIVGGHTTYE